MYTVKNTIYHNTNFRTWKRAYEQNCFSLWCSDRILSQRVYGFVLCIYVFVFQYEVNIFSPGILLFKAPSILKFSGISLDIINKVIFSTKVTQNHWNP